MILQFKFSGLPLDFNFARFIAYNSFGCGELMYNNQKQTHTEQFEKIHMTIWIID